MKTSRVLVAALAALAGALALVAGATGVGHAQDQGSYRIGPEDMLDIVVWNNTTLSRTVPVRPDGMISLPLINDVRAAGLTPMELREDLKKRLAEYIPTPEASVIVREFGSFRVSVIGEVKKPNRYDLKGRVTVLDLLAMAGGFSEFASRTRIVILRHNGDAVQRIPFDYHAIVSPNGQNQNFFLEPGDIVLVP